MFYPVAGKAKCCSCLDVNILGCSSLSFGVSSTVVNGMQTSNSAVNFYEEESANPQFFSGIIGTST